MLYTFFVTFSWCLRDDDQILLTCFLPTCNHNSNVSVWCLLLRFKAKPDQLKFFFNLDPMKPLLFIPVLVICSLSKALSWIPEQNLRSWGSVYFECISIFCRSYDTLARGWPWKFLLMEVSIYNQKFSSRHMWWSQILQVEHGLCLASFDYEGFVVLRGCTKS